MSASDVVAVSAGFLAGTLTYWRGKHNGRRSVSEKPKKGPTCGCRHGLWAHDSKTNACTVAVERSMRDGARTWNEYFQCACVHYVGPIPLEDIWTPGEDN